MNQTETALCGYCEELPEKGRGAAAHVNRCPLCKAELGITGSGRRFRIGADAPAPRGRIAIMAALACAGGVMALAVVALLAFRPNSTPDIVSLPPETTRIVTARLPVVESPAPAAPRDVAVIKPYAEGVLSPEGRLKPQIGPLVPVPSRAEVEIAADPAKPPSALLEKTTKHVGQVQAALLRNLPRLPADYVEFKSACDLLTIQEVGLDQSPARQVLSQNAATEVVEMERQQSKQRLAELTQKIHSKNGKEPDGFVRALIDERLDLAGLPFVLGKACQLSRDQAANLACAAISIREAMSAREKKKVQARDKPSAQGEIGSIGQLDQSCSVFDDLGLNRRGASLSGSPAPTERAALALLPALTQILGPEPPAFRVGLVADYREYKGPQVSAALVRLALYDPERRVRDDAVSALRTRPASEYTDLLLEGLSYPWAPVAQRAADAVVKLERKDLLGRLIAKLDEPDPCDPFERAVDGKLTTPVVREMVKVNHLRNCLLCHAPAGDSAKRGILPVGMVPSPAEKLPPSLSAVGYTPRPGETAVRADVTYLRQDFSVMLPVENAAPWPEMQRFDFMVRTRAVTQGELEAFQEKQRARPPFVISPHRQAVLSALCTLTGYNAGPSAEAWRRMLPPAQSESRK